MRRFTVSVLAVAALAGGALSGAALASPSHHDHGRAEARSADRHGSGHERSRDRGHSERSNR